jgi:hypothetical protein
MRGAAQSHGVAGLAFISFSAAALSRTSAFAEVPARTHGHGLWTVVSLLSNQLLLPATVLASILLTFQFVRDLLARQREARLAAEPVAPPARYAPYALPARVTVALAAAARARC